MITDSLINFSAKLKTQGLERERQFIPATEGLINFSSSDYLSLKENKIIKRGYEKAYKLYPTGSGGSMYICGYHQSHRDLEKAFAKALNADDALLFSSGFAANLSIISLLAKLNANIFIDKAAHASFYDGVQLSKANYKRFLHNNLNDLERKLNLGIDNKVIISESVFSMSGTVNDLGKIVNLAKLNQAACIIDEAHAFGIWGPQGLGLIEQYSLTQQEIPLRMIPFGKAFASQGAIIVGEQAWIRALIQAARTSIYSTALSPALAYGLQTTFEFIQKAEERRSKLLSLIDYFRKKISQSSLKFRESASPIQQLQIGCPHLALKYTASLKDAGIFCQAIRQPTVSKQETGLRIILNYQHEPENIDLLFNQLQKLNESLY